MPIRGAEGGRPGAPSAAQPFGQVPARRRRRRRGTAPRRHQGQRRRRRRAHAALSGSAERGLPHLRRGVLGAGRPGVRGRPAAAGGARDLPLHRAQHPRVQRHRPRGPRRRAGRARVVAPVRRRGAGPRRQPARRLQRRRDGGAAALPPARGGRGRRLQARHGEASGPGGAVAAAAPPHPVLRDLCADPGRGRGGGVRVRPGARGGARGAGNAHLLAEQAQRGLHSALPGRPCRDQGDPAGGRRRRRDEGHRAARRGAARPRARR
mmetsp:Transcript_26624/g.83311  ORF Transcript_26624/g.83311 Transcript_26624/m.83311 type:complete len:265 (+) Transcript_26624:113-907(+)